MSLWILLFIISIVKIFNISFEFESVNYMYCEAYFSITFNEALLLSKMAIRVNHLTLILINLIRVITSEKNEYII